MKLGLLLCIIASTVVLGGCAHTRTNRLDYILASWQGHDPDRLVKTWGAPTGSYTLRDGGQVLTYQHHRMSSRMSFYRYPENYADSFTCKVSFYTDPTHKTIVDSNFQGDASTCLEIAVPVAAAPSASANKNADPDRMQ